MDKYIGKKLDGRFDIQKLIGSGGMANVYKAKDRLDENESIVAVKILKKEYAENEEFLRRFRNESLAIAQLFHPNIVKIIDVGFRNNSDTQYIAMEYIEGITLKNYMEKDKGMEWQTAVHFMLQILRAIGHAHSKGIFHRDIKPQNIMVLKDTNIKVMDFGIAKFAKDEGLTTTAQAIGSVHYISPEQARGGETDERSDIYSAGVVFYEMLTGIKPFDNENPISVALMHMQAKAKRPSDVNPKVPHRLEEIIMKAMEKDPDKRYASAEEMIADIEKFKLNPGRSARRSKEEKGNIMEKDKQTNDINSTRSFRSLDSDKTAESSVAADSSYGYSDTPVIEEEYVEKRSLFVPMLSGIVIVVIIIATIFLAGLLLNYFGGESDYKEFTVSNFVGQEYENAKKLYSKYLVFEVKETKYSQMPANTILEQDLEPNSVVKPGHKIMVVLSKGPKMIDVPPLDNGFTESQAKAILEEKSFSSQTKLVYSDTVQEGYVIKTEPAANTACKEGSTVLVYISRGKMTTQVKLPDINGKKEAEAKKMLEDLDLVVKTATRNSEMPEGTVVGMDFSPNTVVETGSTITVFVS
ncbi:MAG: Stk1 family PASTA domain-containing Ser/Thr kinase, partial [Oscillospiraceae bacterium]|nr:Stk1 family PASTA domain-containing Ser/Thr kinase [Oscillospiraceae bacterium]